MRFAIVGVTFRPFMPQILPMLTPGDPLTLVPDPTNAYDKNAIKVCCSLHDLPNAPDIWNFLVGEGALLSDFQGPTQLGFVARQYTRTIRARGITKATLAFTLHGAPMFETGDSDA